MNRSGMRRLLGWLATLLVMVLIAVVLSRADGPTKSLLVLACGGPALLGFALGSKGNQRLGRFLLWCGAFAPMLYLKPQSTGIVNASAAGTDVLRGVLPVGLAIAGWLICRPRRPLMGPPGWVLLGFILLAHVSLVWSSHPQATFLKAFVLLAGYANLVVLLASYNDVRQAARSLQSALIVIVLWTALQGVMIPGKAWYAGVSGVTRLSSAYPYIHPNELAHVAVAVLFGLAFGLVPGVAARSLTARMGLVAICMVELLLTRSRFGLGVGLGLCVLVLFFEGRRSQVRLFTALAATVLLLGLATYFNPSVSNYFQRGQSERAFSTLTGRTVTWEVAGRLAHERPVLGFGYYTGHRIDFAYRTGSLASNLDNAWVETKLDLGLAGVVLLGTFVATGLLGLFKRLRQPSAELRFLRLIAFYFLAASFINPSIQTNSPSQVVFGFALLAGGAFSMEGRITRTRITSRGVV